MSTENDCRLTIRCLRECFDFKRSRDEFFSTLRTDNSFIDAFFERRHSDPDGGERGERILCIKSSPCFALHYGRTRGATWFERSRGVVWLLRAELHDERHKAGSDAYAVFERHDRAGTLFPEEVDYLLMEYHYRLYDAASFAPDSARDGLKMLAAARRKPGVIQRLPIAGVPARAVLEAIGGTETLTVALSTAPVQGKRSGFVFPLDQKRFLLLAEAVRAALEETLGTEVLVEEAYEVPAGLRTTRSHVERFLVFVF